MPPIHLEVIALIPEGWRLCQSCEALIAEAGLGSAPVIRGLEEIPPDLRSDFHRLSGLLLELSARGGDRLQIRIYDPYSLQGLAKSLRYGVRKYPSFIVEGKEKITGWEMDKLEAALSAYGL